MIKLELPLKMLNFTIEAIEYRIAAYDRDIANPSSSEDEVSDMSNDKMVLRAAVDYMKGLSKLYRDAP
jgi:hypothetical protein